MTLGNELELNYTAAERALLNRQLFLVLKHDMVLSFMRTYLSSDQLFRDSGYEWCTTRGWCYLPFFYSFYVVALLSIPLALVSSLPLLAVTVQ